MARRAGVVAGILALTGCAGAPGPSPSAPPEPAAAAAVVAPDTMVAAPDTAALLAFGQRLNDWFWTAEADSLWAHAGDEVRNFMRDPGQLGDQIYGFVGQFGVETGMLSEALTRQGDNYVYTRVTRLDGSDVPWAIAWTYRPDRTVVNLDIEPRE